MPDLPPHPNLRLLPPCTRLALRSAHPTTPINIAYVTPTHAALHLGPDEWLLLGPATDTQTLLATATTKFASVVDISHRQTAIELTGPHAKIALSAHVALDLDHFPPTSATRTLLSKAEIILWHPTQNRYHIETARSFTPYVWQALTEALQEFPNEG